MSNDTNSNNNSNINDNNSNNNNDDNSNEDKITLYFVQLKRKLSEFTKESIKAIHKYRWFYNAFMENLTPYSYRTPSGNKEIGFIYDKCEGCGKKMWIGRNTIKNYVDKEICQRGGYDIKCSKCNNYKRKNAKVCIPHSILIVFVSVINVLIHACVSLCNNTS